MKSLRSKILKLLNTDATYTSRELAKHFKVAESTISYHIKRLTRDGYLEATNSAGRLHFHPLSRNLSKTPPTFNSKLLSKARIDYEQPTIPSVNEHRAMRVYRLLNPEQHLKGVEEEEYIHLNNNTQEITQIFGLTIVKTSRSLLVKGMMLRTSIGTVTPELIARADQYMDVVAGLAEQEHALKLERDANGRLLGHTTMAEIEIQNHPVAEKIEKRGIIELYWNAQTREVELYTDKSMGLNNIESILKFAATLERMRHLLKLYLNNDWNPEKEQKRLNDLESILATFMEQATNRVKQDNEFRDLQHLKDQQISQLINEIVGRSKPSGKARWKAG